MKPKDGWRFLKGVQQNETSRKEQESQLKDEQQRLLSTPRKFKKSDKLRSLWAVQLFMAAHTLTGPAIISAALFLATVLLFGTTVSGTITGLRITEDSEGAKRYEVKYDYNFNNHLYHSVGNTNRFKYPELKIGGTVTTKLLPSLPNFGQQLLEGNQPWPAVCFMFGFGVMWTVFMLLPFNEVYIAPYRRTEVMKNGKVCLGTITDTSISGEDSNTYALSFQYEPSPGQYRTEKNYVNQEEFNIAKIGDRVSVLYDPKHMGHSLIYRYSDYELIDERNSNYSSIR